MDRIKLFLTDDHELFLQGLKAILDENPKFEIIGKSNNGDETIKALETCDIDILILDIEMPGTNGIVVAKTIREKYPKVKIIALSMYKMRRFIIQMMQVGINGYILKDKSKENLENAIIQVHGGNNYFSPEVMNALSQKDKLADQDPNIQLSDRELEILILVAKGMTSRSIGKKLFIAENTVSKHRRNIMKKLGLHNERLLVHYAIKHDLIQI